MLVLVILLVATNLATLAALAWRRIRPHDHPVPDPLVAASLDAARPSASSTSTRRIITVEVLNPIELAGTRGRLAAIAGSLAPGITRRIVYDKVIHNLRHQLVQERVVADVRLHTVAPGTQPQPSAAPSAEPEIIEVVESEPDVPDR